MTYTEDLIPKGSVNRPCEPCLMQYITVHETANKARGADAKNHAKYLKTLKELKSWHYTVDDKCVYQHLPDNEKSYHTSSRLANEKSIAVEICVNSDGDFEKAKKNAAELISGLMLLHNIPEEHIVSHKYWTGKNCPEQILESGFEKFANMCKNRTKELEKSVQEKILYKVQIGAFESKENADKLAEKAKKQGFSAIIREEKI